LEEVTMSRLIVGRVAALGVLLILGVPSGALAQGQAPSPQEGTQFEIQAPAPAVREATRPRDSEFYPEDIRTRHEPTFIAPLTTTLMGRRVGLSGWTAPPGRGDLTVQREVTGWFAIGITMILDAPEPPVPAVTPRR
jgi:hypothetical protein